MSRLILTAFMGFSALLSACDASTTQVNAVPRRAEVRQDFPPIIMYHEIRTGKIYNSFDVSLESFQKQLSWLQNSGYHTLSLDEMYDAVSSGNSARLKKAVVLAFDDGYRGISDIAAPILRQRRMKANFFIHINALNGKDNPENYPQVNWNEAKALDADPLFTVYSHTVSHPDLRKQSFQELADELRISRETLERRLGGQRRYLAYPMGHYDVRVLDAVVKAGYKMAFSVDDRGTFGHPARYSIPRIYMGTIMDNMELFKHCVVNYRSMDKACFEERWKPLAD